MANIDENLQIAEGATDLLLSQLKDKPNLEALLQSLVVPFQDLESDIFEIRRQQNLDAASDDMLDKWGEMVGITRQGRDDDEYRIQIKAKIAINISKGTIDEVADIFNLLTGATTTYVFEHYPREVSLFCNADLGSQLTITDPPFGYDGHPDVEGYGSGAYATDAGADADYLYNIMDDVLCAGYRIGDILYLPEVEPFAYAGGTGLGYGEGAYATSL
jgi:hypothetical protein